MKHRKRQIVLTEKTRSRYNPKVFRQHNRLAHA